MILSRTLARQRIAAGERPGVIMAWLPVLGDWIAIVLVLWFLWEPVMRWTDAMQSGTAATIALFFLIFFLPMQIVLITSAIWAVKSRWIGTEDNTP